MTWTKRRAWAGLTILLGGTAAGQVTTLVSQSTSGVQASGVCTTASISADGRYVAFRTYASNLATGDGNGTWDVYLRDRQAGTTEVVSVTPNGSSGNGPSDLYLSRMISQDGRFVAFTSGASDLVAGDSNFQRDVFVRDRQSGTTELVSVSSTGEQGDDESLDGCLSADGRFVAFESYARNFAPGSSIRVKRIFVRDRQNGTTQYVSEPIGGAQANTDSFSPSISADGRYVAFTSGLADLVVGDVNGMQDVFVCDLLSGTTELVSLASSGAQGNNPCGLATISADGNCVAFESAASNLVAGDTNGAMTDVFVRDRTNGTTDVVSVSTSGAHGPHNTFGTSISADGRFVTFYSYSSLIQNDTNGDAIDIFVRDRQAGTTEVASRNSAGYQANRRSEYSTISDDGRYVAFESDASNLVPHDANGPSDIFMRDRQIGSGNFAFTSLCTPGTGGVIACPCSNPPTGADLGCDNSTASGGAAMTATGVTELASDGLTITTTGEPPTALSVLVQGDTLLAGGAVYGQGVRCAGGRVLRLYTKTASGGSIQVPDWSLWEAPISQRSAGRGDVIQPGQSRWYFVYYRDPVVLGGCPATSTFNATQTGRVDWSM